MNSNMKTTSFDYELSNALTSSFLSRWDPNTDDKPAALNFDLPVAAMIIA